MMACTKTATTEPLRRKTEDALRDAIVGGKFLPGTRLKERILTDMFGVSRTSLREALRQIESEGLITLEPNRGPVVATLTYEDAEEIYEVRGMLETHACVAFCQRASKAQMNSLKVIFAAIETACRQGDIESVLLHSAEYYQVIKEGCGNRILRKMLSQIHNRTNILRRLSLSQPGRMADTLAELQELTDAINARDESAAGKASTHHVRQAGRIALRAMRDRLKIT